MAKRLGNLLSFHKGRISKDQLVLGKSTLFKSGELPHIIDIMLLDGRLATYHRCKNAFFITHKSEGPDFVPAKPKSYPANSLSELGTIMKQLNLKNAKLIEEIKKKPFGSRKGSRKKSS